MFSPNGHEREDNAAVTGTALEDDEAISTSGDHERYFEEDGVRCHHMRVPGTGRFRGLVRSVTVIGATATYTDGLTKPIFIRGRAAPGVRAPRQGRRGRDRG